MKNRLRYLLIMLPGCMAMFGQHKTTYSQFMFNGMLLNPAYAGSHEALNLTALYRNQWAALDGAPRAISFTAHSPFKKKKLSAGVIFENEQAGLFNHSQAMGALAYRVRLGKTFLSFGLQGGADIRAFDRDALRVRHGEDPVFMQNNPRTTEFVAGTGVYWHGASFYAGFAAPDLTTKSANDAGLLQLHAGAVANVAPDFKLKPSLLVRHLDHSPLLVNMAVTTYYKDILGIGAGYTARASWFVYLDLRINDQLNFGYAHERATGRLAAYNAGTHEVMLRYLFRYRITAANPRYF